MSWPRRVIIVVAGLILLVGLAGQLSVVRDGVSGVYSRFHSESPISEGVFLPIPKDTGSTPMGSTCAFPPNNRGPRIGCLSISDEANGDCNLDISRKSGWLFAQEGFTGYADVNAKRVRPGTWSIRKWPGREPIGTLVALNDAGTRWRITDANGKPIAVVRGQRGPEIAAVLLYWGAGCLY